MDDLNRTIEIISLAFELVYLAVFVLVFVLKYRKYKKQGGFIHLWKQNPKHFRVKIILIPLAITIAYFISYLVFLFGCFVFWGVPSMVQAIFSIMEVTA
ncbi:hypothetical protein FACS189499_03400 [Clostridia bacterium]|nr:hypothetical protein FACS189499_03400 [Clostridia bacterium]